MEYKKIKEIGVKLNELFNLSLSYDQNLNYIQYISEAFFNAEDCNADIKEFLDNVFQDLNINYSITFNGKYQHKLYIEDVKFDITIKRKTIVFSRSINYGWSKKDRNIYQIQLGQTISNIKALEKLMLEVSSIKIKEYNDNLIKERISKSENFAYQWDVNDYNNGKGYTVKYKPLGINVRCVINNKCIEFVSYLHYEGETYNSGNEPLTTEEILNEIKHYQSLLDHEPIIREQLASL